MEVACCSRSSGVPSYRPVTPDVAARASWATVVGDSSSTRTTRSSRRVLTRFRGREVETAGDGFFATFDGSARAVRAACAIRDGLRALGLEIRAGIHTGERELVNGGVRGIAVDAAAQVVVQAAPGQVLASSTVGALLAGSGTEFAEAGSAELKDVGVWQLYKAIAA